MNNRIIVKKNLFLSYIFHILDLGNNDFDTEYSIAFKDIVEEKDKELLRELRSYLSYYNGSEGKLFDVMVRLPAYLGLNSPEDFKKYWYLLETCLQKEDFTDFEVYYNNRYLQFDFWQGFSTENYLNSIRDYSDLMKDIIDIYYRNFEKFKNNVWCKEKNMLSSRANEIEASVNGIDIVGKWELFGNIVFEPENMEFFIVSSIQNNIKAISLGFERKVLSGNFPTEQYKDIITYETGLNLFNPYLKKLIQNSKYPIRLIYNCYEAVLYYFTKIITENEFLLCKPENKVICDIVQNMISEGFEDFHELFDNVLEAVTKQ
ncbi:MAG: hypothetical protein M0R46_13445 [Candidatus Muirbacterium halophilum]|nr:hypothetical protein [Candidatus Muirbacterium halophilum]MCK9476926.1 hypothetical protein [Candidatus Muirbacterium halophilum]